MTAKDKHNNKIRTAGASPEKAGVGGSIPSLATTPIRYRLYRAILLANNAANI